MRVVIYRRSSTTTKSSTSVSEPCAEKFLACEIFLGIDGLMGNSFYRLPQGLAASCARALRPGTISTFSIPLLRIERLVLCDINDIRFSIRFERESKDLRWTNKFF